MTVIPPTDDGNDFASQADDAEPGLARDFADFLRHNRKWWLAPLIVALVGLGTLVIVTSTVFPWIYALF